MAKEKGDREDYGRMRKVIRAAKKDEHLYDSRKGDALHLVYEANEERKKGDYGYAFEKLNMANSLIFEPSRHPNYEMPSDEEKEKYGNMIERNARRLIRDVENNYTTATKDLGKSRFGNPARLINYTRDLIGTIESHKSSGKKSKLETSVAAVIAGVSGIGALFFLSTNMTGNVVGSFNNVGMNRMGLILAAVAIIAGFLFFNKRK